MAFRLFKKIILFSLLSACILSTIDGKTKRALLIGIGKYQASTDWQQLHGDNDVQLLRNALRKQAFKDRHINTLTNKKASRKKILKAIQKLIKKTKEGDIIVFHYSGHGQQIKDDNQDEVDGLDEAIVPFDSPKLFNPEGYKGEKLIRDDELYELFDQLRKKLGKDGHLLVVLDTCHSGTGTRGLSRSKGTNSIMASSNYLSNLNKKYKDKSQVENEPTKEILAPMVAIFSSMANQLSHELTGTDGKDYGYLTYALHEQLSRSTENTSYQELMADVRIFINSNGSPQIPILEGNDSLSVLAGSLLIPMNYCQAKKLTSSSIRIEVGTLQGIYKGSRVSFYLKTTKDTSQVAPLAWGEVVYTEALWSEVKLDTPLRNPPPLKAVITEKSYKDLNINVKIVLEDSLTRKFSKALDTSFITIVEDQPDLLLIKENGYIQLRNQSLKLLLKTKSNSIKELLDACRFAARAKALRKLEMPDNRYKGTINLIREEKGTGTDSLVFSVEKKEGFRIEITNTGTRPFYFNVLDIEPNNEISLLPLGTDSKNKELKSEESFTSKTVFKFEGPLGIEVLKLITSPEPLDLSAIIQSTPSRGNSKNHPLDIFFKDRYLTNNLRGANPSVRVGTVGIYTNVYNIKK